MLTNWNPARMPEKDEMKLRLSTARKQLYDLQMKIKEHKIPVIVLFEGWGTSGKGSTIGKVIRNIDPRFFKVVTMSEPTDEELRYPFLYRFFKEIPEAGKFTFLDSGWLEQICREHLEGKTDEKEYASRIESVRNFERQLTDNGYLVLKFFMQIEKKEQKEREQDLLESKDTKWRVSLFDQWENTHYKKCKKAFSKYMSDTNASSAPWYIIDAGDQKWAELQVMETLVSNIEVALQNQAHSVPILQNVFPLEPIPRLADIDLQDKILNDEEYKKELKQLQIELGKLHNKLYRKRIPVIITYEGWDAAGKGGNIKRITEALDPRGYEVQPIASLEPEIGKIRFLLIYLGSGLMGNLVSAWLDVSQGSYAVSAGASGAIFGIVGALLYVAIRNHGRVGEISTRGLVLMAGLSLYYGFTAQGVDNAAHIGGLISGFLLAVLTYWKHKPKHY